MVLDFRRSKIEIINDQVERKVITQLGKMLIIVMETNTK